MTREETNKCPECGYKDSISNYCGECGVKLNADAGGTPVSLRVWIYGFLSFVCLAVLLTAYWDETENVVNSPAPEAEVPALVSGHRDDSYWQEKEEYVNKHLQAYQKGYAVISKDMIDKGEFLIKPHPCLVEGDFDGDGENEYAAFICKRKYSGKLGRLDKEWNEIVMANGEAAPRSDVLLVVLDVDDGNCVILDKDYGPTPYKAMWRIPKGRITPYFSDKGDIVMLGDGIERMMGSNSAITYYYDGTRYDYCWTMD